MARLIVHYIPDTKDEDEVMTTFAIDNSPHISTIHRLMKQAALAMGYTEKNVEEWFGETRFID